MSYRKPPNKVSDEELLKIIQETEGQDDTPDAPEAYDILAFLGHFNIKDGSHRVRTTTLYRLYQHWSKDPVSVARFQHLIFPYLVHSYAYGNIVVLLINADALDIGKRTMRIIAAQSQERTKSKTYRKHFENYLTRYGLAPGTYWIESYILYHLYDLWCSEINRKNQLGEKTFFNFCNLYFKSRRRTVSRMMWFAVSKSILKHLTEEQLSQLREGRRNRYGGKGKKRKSKKQTEVSGVKAPIQSEDPV